MQHNSLGYSISHGLAIISVIIIFNVAVIFVDEDLVTLILARICLVDVHVEINVSNRTGAISNMVPAGQGKLEKVREFSLSGKVRENAELLKKSGKMEMLFHVH